MPQSACGPCRFALNSNDVTAPKLPPPPRKAQNRSGFSASLARRRSPSAVTMSTDPRLAQAYPNLREVQPKPPPMVKPATPVGYDPAWNDQAEGLGLVIDVAPRRAAFDPNDAAVGIDAHATPQAHVDHQSAVAE